MLNGEILYLSLIDKKIEWLSANTPRIRNGEIRMVKYVYVVITIMNDILWRGREGFLPLVGC